jgi:hypothetical protein
MALSQAFRLTKDTIEGLLTGTILSHQHPKVPVIKEEVEGVLTGLITSHTHPLQIIPTFASPTISEKTISEELKVAYNRYIAFCDYLRVKASFNPNLVTGEYRTKLPVDMIRQIIHEQEDINIRVNLLIELVCLQANILALEGNPRDIAWTDGVDIDKTEFDLKIEPLLIDPLPIVIPEPPKGFFSRIFKRDNSHD